MKNNLLLNTLRSVKKYPGRFVAIMSIIAISCAFYSGVKAACPDMKRSGWEYYDKYCLADIQIKSTLGFDEDDIDKLLENEEFGEGYAGYSADVLTNSGYGSAAVKVMSYSEEQPLNKLLITEGRLPEAPNECVADASPRSKVTFSVGDTVTLFSEKDEDIGDYLSSTEYTVVGLAMSPLYVTSVRGATSISNGTLNGFIYIPEENFTYDKFTDIYLSVPAAHASSVEPFSDEYEDIVEAAEDYAEELSEDFLGVRAESIRAEAEEELSDARKKLADGEKELSDGKKKYEDGLKKYNDADEELKAQRADIDSARAEIDDGMKEIEENEVKLLDLADTCVKVDKFLVDYENVYMKVLPDVLLNVFNEIQTSYDNNNVEVSIVDLMAVYIITDPEKDPVSKTSSRQAIIEVNNQVRYATDAALGEIRAQKAVLEETSAQLDEGEETLSDYEKELSDSKKELDDAQKELDDASAKIADAQKEIADAEAEIDDLISDAEWYVWNRDEFNPGCYSYGRDAERVDSIANAFPIFFILIAALVCWTTMSRMVEEQRTETGVLKALGYSSASIIMQYVLYAAAASIIGSLIGTAVGFALLPKIIYICYTTMYCYPDFSAPFMPLFALGCMGASLLVTALAAVYTAVRELNVVPASLIRPKPPKNGKRIFLERIGFIWKHMKFTHKVSFRNILRYKSRFLMTLIGIGGCTALLLTGFGLKEGISCIADKQYTDICLYDAMVVIDDGAEEAELVEIEAVIDGRSEILSHMNIIQETKKASFGDSSFDCYVFSPESCDDINSFIILRDRKTHTPITLETGSIVINEKLGRLIGAGVGDEIILEGAAMPLKVSAITENYTYHYAYMTRDTYENAFGSAKNNMILLNTGNTPAENIREEISSELISCEAVISASFIYDGTDSFRKLVSSLDLIVAVIVLFTGALSFVILYNLANININERIRELATIKVLGFFDGEVGAYVYRENSISAVVGIAAGLILGIFFEAFVIRNCEVDEVMFSPDIPWYCFIRAAVVMVIFTVTVNIFLYFKLKKIDMAASMKAIE